MTPWQPLVGLHLFSSTFRPISLGTFMLLLNISSSAHRQITHTHECIENWLSHCFHARRFIYRGDANVAEVVLGLELSLEVTLLHVIEGYDADVRILPVVLPSGPDLFHHPRNLQAVGVALSRQERLMQHTVSKRVMQYLEETLLRSVSILQSGYTLVKRDIVGCSALASSHPSLVLSLATTDVHPFTRLAGPSCELELLRGLQFVVVERGRHNLFTEDGSWQVTDFSDQA